MEPNISVSISLLFSSVSLFPASEETPFSLKYFFTLAMSVHFATLASENGWIVP